MASTLNPRDNIPLKYECEPSVDPHVIGRGNIAGWNGRMACSGDIASDFLSLGLEIKTQQYKMARYFDFHVWIINVMSDMLKRHF